MKSLHILIAAVLLPVSVSAAAQDDPNEPSTGPVENATPDASDQGHASDAEDQGDILVTEANIDEAEPADEGAGEPEGSARA